MTSIQRLAAFAAIAPLPLFLSTASWGWFWEKTNTVQVYEACLKENRSNFIDGFVISKKCIDKLAGPVPVDQVKIEYAEERPYAALAVVDDEHRNMVLHTVKFSAENFLLTSVTTTVGDGPGSEKTVTVEANIPKSSLSTPGAIAKVISAKGFAILIK